MTNNKVLSILLGSLFLLISSISVQASETIETQIEIPHIISSENYYNRSVNISKTINIAAYKTYDSGNFDMNKVWEDDHTFLTIKLTTSSSNLYSLYITEDGKEIVNKSLIGNHRYVYGPYNNPSKKYKVVVQNRSDSTLPMTVQISSGY